MQRRTRETYKYILDAFPRLGRAPTLEEMARDLNLELGRLTDGLRTLEREGALRLDPESSRVVGAYPYSAVPTTHTVTLESGVELNGMCAIDCFYVPFLASPGLTIRSQCHVCDREISLRIDGLRVSALNPDTTIIWSSEASFDCPQTNFFCDESHLRTWRETHPGEPGRACSIEEALERGRRAADRIRQRIGHLPGA